MYQKKYKMSLTSKSFLECQVSKNVPEMIWEGLKSKIFKVDGMSHLELSENAPEAMYEQSKM